MLNPKEEAKFIELKDKCRELGVPAPPEIMIGLKVHDKNGILVFDDVQRGHSWTRNYWNNLLSFSAGTVYDADGSTFGAGYMNYKQITGAVLGTASGGFGAMENVIGTIGSELGIQVGTGDTAFSAEQFNLVALIAHGVTSGTLSYAAQSAATKSYASKIWTITMVRIFNNNSGGSITVKEAGIMRLGGYPRLLERTVLDSPVAVAIGAQLTVTYEISMDFTAID